MTFPSIELPRTLEMFSSSMNNGRLYCSPPPRCSNLHFALFSHYLDRKCEFYGILDERNGARCCYRNDSLSDPGKHSGFKLLSLTPLLRRFRK